VQKYSQIVKYENLQDEGLLKEEMANAEKEAKEEKESHNNEIEEPKAEEQLVRMKIMLRRGDLRDAWQRREHILTKLLLKLNMESLLDALKTDTFAWPQEWFNERTLAREKALGENDPFTKVKIDIEIDVARVNS
jgi:hypothetical protein